MCPMGAVHFTSCVSTAAVAATETGTDTGHERKSELRDHMQGVLGKPTNSYAPQFSLHSGELLKKPSFRKVCVCVGDCVCVSVCACICIFAYTLVHIWGGK